MRCALECSPQAAQAIGLPPPVPCGVRCNPADGCIDVSYGTLTAIRVFGLRAEALGALLISRCNRAGMAMPRHSRKGIRVERDRVVLVISVPRRARRMRCRCSLRAAAEHQADFGPDVERGIPEEPPEVTPGEQYTVLVPAVDRDGNDARRPNCSIRSNWARQTGSCRSAER